MSERGPSEGFDCESECAERSALADRALVSLLDMLENDF